MSRVRADAPEENALNDEDFLPRLIVTFIALVLPPIVLIGSGCRSLRTNRHTRALTDARKLSLDGADQLQQENYVDADTLFTEALKHSSADERAHWGRAEVLWHQGERSQAIQHMVQAVNLSGNNPELIVRLGEMYLSENDLERALKQAEEGLAHNWKNPDAWALKGQVMRMRNDLDEAHDCYQIALIHDPNNQAARVAVADIYQIQGQPQRALATLDRLSDGQSMQQIPARAWLLKGQAWADLGQHRDSKNCLRNAAICANEDDPALLLDLARVQYQSGDLAEARICLGRALRTNPNNPNCLNFQSVLDQSFDNYSNQESLPAMTARWQRTAKE